MLFPWVASLPRLGMCPSVARNINSNRYASNASSGFFYEIITCLVPPKVTTTEDTQNPPNPNNPTNPGSDKKIRIKLYKYK